MNGHLHPLTQFMRLSLQYFTDLGFVIYEGNEIESEWYNFDVLNIPSDHPARDVQDTFWLAPKSNHKSTSEVAAGLLRGGKEVLRTHNTGSEMSIIKNLKIKPPFRIIVPGRCYRNERTDMTHEHTFYQIDGIICDKDINMTHLIGILENWIRFILDNNVKIRLRPHYYPFVEPGMDIDIQLSDGRWREMLGAGMAHPIVLKNMGINPDKYQAAMWGPGIDRFTMIKYGINDIRCFHSQDLRFLKQF